MEFALWDDSSVAADVNAPRAPEELKRFLETISSARCRFLFLDADAYPTWLRAQVNGRLDPYVVTIGTRPGNTPLCCHRRLPIMLKRDIGPDGYQTAVHLTRARSLDVHRQALRAQPRASILEDVVVTGRTLRRVCLELRQRAPDTRFNVFVFLACASALQRLEREFCPQFAFCASKTLQGEPLKECTVVCLQDFRHGYLNSKRYYENGPLFEPFFGAHTRAFFDIALHGSA